MFQSTSRKSTTRVTAISPPILSTEPPVNIHMQVTVEQDIWQQNQLDRRPWTITSFNVNGVAVEEYSTKSFCTVPDLSKAQVSTGNIQILPLC